MPDAATLDRAQLAAITGGATAREWAHDLLHTGAVTTGQVVAGTVCFGVTSVPLHGKFFVPPRWSWKTFVPYGSMIGCSTGVGAVLNRVVP
jgi:hypothetical protein